MIQAWANRFFRHRLQSIWGQYWPRQSWDWKRCWALLPMGLIPLGTATGLSLLEMQGSLELLELKIFDYLVASRPGLPPDDRFLVVGITEEDLQQYRWPIPDQELAAAIDRLQVGGAKVIGIDLYRDIPEPPGTQALAEHWRAPNIVGILELGQTSGLGVEPPPELDASQIGFNDLLLDPDSVVRRGLLSARAGNQNYQSLAFRLARHYLQEQGIQPQLLDHPPEGIAWGATTLEPLNAYAGGYAELDSRGYQLLIDYPVLQEGEAMVNLTDLLEGRVPADRIENRIVLVGSVAPSLKDQFFTPSSSREPDSAGEFGVIIHTQLTRYLINLALGEQDPLHFWPRWVERGWLLTWALVAVLFLYRRHHPLVLFLTVTVGLGGLGVLHWILFSLQIWTPLISPALSFLLSGAIILGYSRYQIWQVQQSLLQQAQVQNETIAQLQVLEQRALISPPQAPQNLPLPSSDRTAYDPTLLPEEELATLQTQDFSAEVQAAASTHVPGAEGKKPDRFSPLGNDTVQELVQSIGGRYAIQEILGQGGFGMTYLAADKQRPGSPICVIKRLYPSRTDPVFMKLAQRLFRTEAQILEQLGRNWDRIPQLLAYFEDATEFYLVQDYVEGEPLSQELERVMPCSPSAVEDLLLEVLPTLQFIHRNHVIHRDLKPGNLIRRGDGQIVLIDFGAVKHLTAEKAIGNNPKTLGIGTMGYVAPEQLAGHPHFCSDLYALGMIGIQALIGLHPQNLDMDFDTGDLGWKPVARDIHGDDPKLPGLMPLLEKLTQFDTSDRYRTAEEVLTDLKNLKKSRIHSTVT